MTHSPPNRGESAAESRPQNSGEVAADSRQGRVADPAELVRELAQHIEVPLATTRELIASSALNDSHDRAALLIVEDVLARAAMLVLRLEERLERAPASHGSRRAGALALVNFEEGR